MNIYLQQRRQRDRRLSSVLSLRPDPTMRRLSTEGPALLDSLALSFHPEPTVPSLLVFMPESSFCFLWDIVSVTMLLYQAFELPLVFCFEIALPVVVVGLDFGVSVFFILDIGTCYLGVNFTRAVYVKGKLRIKHREIAWIYLQCWFWVDLLASTPYNWLTGDFFSEPSLASDDSLASVDRTPQFLRLLRLCRLLRLVRLAKLRRLMLRLESMVSSEALSSVIVFAQLLFVILALGHWLACAWYVIGLQESIHSPSSWVAVAQQRGGGENLTSLYISSLYWAMTTMTTVGYGDIVPWTRGEMWFAIFGMVVASGTFAYVLGSFGALVQHTTAEEELQRHQQQSVNRYLKTHKVPRSTVFRVKRFLEYQQEYLRRNQKEEELLLCLSESLREEIYEYVNGVAVKLYPLLASLDTAFISKLSRGMERGSYAPDDLVFEQNQWSSNMYFLVSGEVCVLHNSSPLRMLSPGSYFGEISFLLRVPRCASVRCCAFVQLMYITKDWLMQCLDTFPRVLEKFNSLIRSCDQGDLSSLQVICYTCGEPGHISSRCSNASLAQRKLTNLNKWIDSRKVKTKYVNPSASPSASIYRNPHRKVKMRPSFYRVVGMPFQPEEAYPSSARLRLLVKETGTPRVGEATLRDDLVEGEDKEDLWERKVKTEVVRKEVPPGQRVEQLLEEESFTFVPEEVRKQEFRRDLLTQSHPFAPIVDMERYSRKPDFEVSSDSSGIDPFSGRLSQIR